MQDRPKRTPTIGRRSFLRIAGGASTAAAATLGPTAAQAYDPGAEEMRSRYRETDHVKAFYRVNRYPAHKS